MRLRACLACGKRRPAGPEGHPFIDKALWGCCLNQKRDELLALMAGPANS